tara:strand:- start:477 stop:587 length:111 start_codon:yes stop_codon:yes gene_type:complete
MEALGKKNRVAKGVFNGIFGRVELQWSGSSVGRAKD